MCWQATAHCRNERPVQLLLREGRLSSASDAAFGAISGPEGVLCRDRVARAGPARGPDAGADAQAPPNSRFRTARHISIWFWHPAPIDTLPRCIYACLYGPTRRSRFRAESRHFGRWRRPPSITIPSCRDRSCGRPRPPPTARRPRSPSTTTPARSAARTRSRDGRRERARPRRAC